MKPIHNRLAFYDVVKSQIDYLWWKKNVILPKELHFQQAKPFLESPLPNEPKIASYFQNDNEKWYHHEYLYLFPKQILIEPDYGYAIFNYRHVLPESQYHTNLYPSFLRLLKSFFQSKNYLHEAVLFDGHYGGNYFHFFSDVINKLWVLDTQDIDSSIPLIIGEKTYQTSYFQQLLHHPELSKRNWVVQKTGQYIKVGQLYMAHPMPYAKEHWLKTLSLVKDLSITVKPSRRIFLDRSKKSGRYLENREDLIPILEKAGFEIVDTEGMSLMEQVVLFSETSHLVAIHGAGNTNILFAYPHRLKFLEICPENRISCQYYWLSHTLGYEYYCLLGSSLPYTNRYPELGFQLSPKKLQEALDRLLGK